MTERLSLPGIVNLGPFTDNVCVGKGNLLEHVG